MRGINLYSLDDVPSRPVTEEMAAKARRAVAQHSTGVDDAADLLAMLGIS